MVEKLSKSFNSEICRVKQLLNLNTPLKSLSCHVVGSLTYHELSIKLEEKIIHALLTRYVNFCVFDESTNVKACDVVVKTTACLKFLFRLLLLNPR